MTYRISFFFSSHWQNWASVACFPSSSTAAELLISEQFEPVSHSAGRFYSVWKQKKIVGIYVKMDLRKVFYASAVYIMRMIIIMCGLFVCFSHCIRSSVCFFFLDRFTSSPPYVALLLSQIYFFIVLGSNALTVKLFKKGD